jgi:hypothetical protein
MWYMQPCWPDLRAIRFWRDFIALSAFGAAGAGAGHVEHELESEWLTQRPLTAKR